MGRFDELFEDCRVSETCESDPILGVAGVCDLVTGLCMCPPDYHGKDDYAEYNDCHIYIPVQRGIYIACTVIASLLLVHTVFGYFCLLHRWGFLDALRDRALPRSLRTENRTLQSINTATMTARPAGSLNANSMSVLVDTEAVSRAKAFSRDSFDLRSESPVVASNVSTLPRSKKPTTRGVGKPPEAYEVASNAATDGQGGQDAGLASHLPGGGGSGSGAAGGRTGRILRRRQRETLLSIALFILFATGLLMYYIPMLRGIRRFDADWLQNFGAALAVAAVFSGVWMMSYMWYRSLPSVHLYGRLFNIHSVLLRWPHLVKCATIVNVAFVNLTTFLLIFVLPQTRPQLRNTYDAVVLKLFVVYLVVFICYFTTLCTIIRRVFIQLDKLNNGVRDGSDAPPRAQPMNRTLKDADAFKKGVKVVNIMLGMTIVLGATATASSFLAAFVPFFTKRLYLSVSLVGVSASLVANVCTYVFVRRLNGPQSSSAARHRGTLPGGSVTLGADGQLPRGASF